MKIYEIEILVIGFYDRNTKNSSKSGIFNEKYLANISIASEIVPLFGVFWCRMHCFIIYANKTVIRKLVEVLGDFGKECS